MNSPIEVAVGEQHVLRVFTLEMTRAQIDHLCALLIPEAYAVDSESETKPASYPDPDSDPGPIAGLFGLAEIDTDYVEIFDVRDLADIGLSAYLIEGNGVAATQIAADRARLDGLRGFVVIVYSAAFGGKPATLRPMAALSLIGVYTEEVPSLHFEELPSASARGILEPGLGKPPPSDARIGGMVALVALLFAFALTAFVVWLAG